MNKKLGLFAAAFAVVAVGAASSGPAGTENTVGAEYDVVAFEAPDYALDELADVFDVAVIGTVTAVSAPQWNSADGRDWVDRAEQNQFTAPMLLTQFEFDVSEVLWSADGVESVATGSQTFWTLGDAARYESSLDAETDGLHIGAERLLFLERAPLAFEDGYTKPVWRTFLGSATWNADGTDVWPHSHAQIAGLRAAAARGAWPDWAPGSSRESSLEERVPSHALAAMLRAFERGNRPDLVAAVRAAAPGLSHRPEDAPSNVGDDQIDARALLIENAIIVPLEDQGLVSGAGLEIWDDASLTPVLSLSLVDTEDEAPARALDVIAGVRGLEKLEVRLYGPQESPGASAGARTEFARCVVGGGTPLKCGARE